MNEVRFSWRWFCARVAGVIILVLLLAPSGASAFTDVPIGHEYAGAINDLSVRGIINGYDDGTFRPSNPVWRGQFAKMIVGAFYLPCDESMTSSFKDLGDDKPNDLYPHEYVSVAAANGITRGYSATEFRPYQNISRAHVVTMVVRALDRLYPGALEVPSSGSVPFTWDEKLRGTEHLGNAKVAYHYANGLLEGLDLYGGASDPWAPMPRGEVAQVLYNMKELLPDPEVVTPFGQPLEWQGTRITVSGPVNDPGTEYSRPDPGSKWVAFEVTIENLGTTTVRVNGYDFVVYDSAGNKYDNLIFGLEPYISVDEIVPGARMQAWKTLEVPAIANLVKFVYDPTWSDIALLVWK